MAEPEHPAPCHDPDCGYQEPHKHGFACNKSCSCSSQAIAANVLEQLDFAVICAMTHNGLPCARPATHLATIHRCGKLAGVRAPICAYAMAVFETLNYPLPCRCGIMIQRRTDFVWNIEPL